MFQIFFLDFFFEKWFIFSPDMGSQVSHHVSAQLEYVRDWWESDELRRLRRENELLRQQLENASEESSIAVPADQTLIGGMGGPSMADLERAAEGGGPRGSQTIVKRPWVDE